MVSCGAPTFLLLANFRQILTWKIWFGPIGRIFHEKNGPSSSDFEKKILPITRFLLLVPVGSQKYRKIFIFSYFHISTCGQIWLNHFQDDSHLGSITKLEKEPCGALCCMCTTCSSYSQVVLVLYSSLWGCWVGSGHWIERWISSKY